ncbi:hypothetical protein ACVGOW_19565 [Pseudonocardia saturnea]
MKYARSPVLDSMRRLATLAVTTLAVSLGVAAGSAEASVGALSATLGIRGVEASFAADVRVTGHVPMTAAEASALIGSGHRVVFRLWGSDTFDDDFIGGPYTMSVRASSRGLEFTGTRRLATGALDEDGGCIGIDEVYAGVRLLDRNGSTVRKAETDKHVEQWCTNRVAALMEAGAWP